MTTQKKSFFYYNVSPFLQAGIVVSTILIFNIFSSLIKLSGLVDIDPGTPWLIFTSFVLFFILVNGILSISIDNQKKYWLQSLCSYILILLIGGLLSMLFSGVTMEEAGSYRFILILFSFCYILILGITNAIRKIVMIAQKQDHRLRGED